MTDITATETSVARAVIYLRVSTKEQAEMGGRKEGFSIPAQREACRRKAESLEAEVVEEFVDRGESARSANRPELQKMLAYLREQQVQYVIVHKVDRLARDRFDDASIYMEIKAAGATLVSVSENIDETPSGRLLHAIMSGVAEFYSRNLANEVMKGLTQKIRAGGTVGKAPVGYLNIRTIENGREARTIQVDPVNGPLMRWAFEQYATGRWTLRALLEELTERGLRTVPGPKTPAKSVSGTHFHYLMHNPYYAGWVIFRGAKHPGAHEPLITQELFDEVQRVLAANDSLHGTKQRKHPHYLKGSLYCGNCLTRLSVEKVLNKQKIRYEYFYCLGRQAHKNGCSFKVRPIDEIEQAIEDYYSTVCLPDEIRIPVEEFVRSEMLEQRHRAEAELAKHDGRRRQLETERHKLLEAHYASAIPLDLLRSEQQRIAAELKALAKRLTACQMRFEDIENNLKRCLDLVQNCQELYRQSSPLMRRMLNQAIFERLDVLLGGQVQGKLAEPFEGLAGEKVRKALKESAPHLPLNRRGVYHRQKPGRREAEIAALSHLFSGRSSNNQSLAEEVGFEPTDP